jgi:hypothetical protein
MLSKKNITLTTLAAVAGTLLILSQSAWTTPHRESLGGTWVGQVKEYGVQWCGIQAPLDSAGQKASLKWQWVALGPEFTALFAQFGGQSSESVGELEMINHNTAKYTQMFYIVKPANITANPPTPSVVTGICVMKGTWHCTGPDSAYSNDTLLVYTADADKNHDGLPDAGATPAIPPMYFNHTQHHRVPILD